LRQQANLRKAVDDHPLRLDAFDRFEHALDRLAEFEVGRVKQTLVLVRIENALGRHQFADFDVVIELPAVGQGALPQFMLGFAKADVNAGLTGFRAGHQELQRNRGLAGAGAALEQMQPVAGPSSAEDAVEAFDAGRSTRKLSSRVNHDAICREKRGCGRG
jgi:hypothetical protein